MKDTVVAWGAVLAAGVLAMILRASTTYLRFFRPVVPLVFGMLLRPLTSGTFVCDALDGVVFLESATLRSWIVPATIVYSFQRGYGFLDPQCRIGPCLFRSLVGFVAQVLAYTYVSGSVAVGAALSCTDPTALFTITDGVAARSKTFGTNVLEAMVSTICSIYTVAYVLDVGQWWQYVVSLCVGWVSAWLWRGLAVFLRTRGDTSTWLTLLLIAPYAVYAVSESVLEVCGVGAVAVYGLAYARTSERNRNDDVDRPELACMRSISVTSENVFYVIMGMYVQRNWSSSWTPHTFVLVGAVTTVRMLHCAVMPTLTCTAAEWTFTRRLAAGVQNFRGPIGVVIASALPAEHAATVLPVMAASTVVSALLGHVVDKTRDVGVLHERTARDETLLGRT